MRALIVVLGLAIAGCSAEEPPPPEPAAPEGRAETQSIRNTEAVGYSGNAIADKVDSAIDKSAEADKKLKEEADRQSAEE